MAHSKEAGFIASILIQTTYKEKNGWYFLTIKNEYGNR